MTAPGDVDGVLVDDKGRVRASWSSFAVQAGNDSVQLNRGIGAELIRQFVDTVEAGKPFYSLEAEFVYAPLFAARKMGVDEDWIERLEKADPSRRRALSITRIVADTPAAEKLQNGDLLLAVDGETVTSYLGLENAVQKPRVEVTVWRNGEVFETSIDTVALSGRSIDKAASWGGALLQNPHRALAAQRGVETDGVYVAYFNYGSPATRYGLWAGRRVIEVNGQGVADLDAFIAAVRDLGHGESVRLKTITWNGTPEVITLRVDNQYWPAYEIRRVGDDWRRVDFGS